MKWKDSITGGLADKKSPQDFDKESLKAGIKVELEHTDDKKIAIEIAMDHLSEDPLYYEKLKKMENENMTIPKLTEVFSLKENKVKSEVSRPGQLDTGDYRTYKPGVSSAVRSAAKSQEKRQKAASARRAKKAGPPMKQQSLPGMEKTFGFAPEPPPPSFPKINDGRPPLAQVAGKFMHTGQHNYDLSPYMLKKTGKTYETIPSDAFKQTKIDDNPNSQWGEHTLKINDDGTLTMQSQQWDSSG